MLGEPPPTTLELLLRERPLSSASVEPLRPNPNLSTMQTSNTPPRRNFRSRLRATFTADFLRKALLASVCFGFFLAESTSSFRKYLLGMKTTAVTVEPMAPEDVPWPLLVFCRTEPYRRKGLISTKEEYESRTYDFNETFVGFGESGKGSLH